MILNTYMICKIEPLSNCCLTCCCTITSCCGVKSAPCKPCKTIRGPWIVCITCAVTHLITVPGGWPTNKDASTLPGGGALEVWFVVVAVVVDVTFVDALLLILLFVVSVDCAPVVVVAVDWVDCSTGTKPFKKFILFK